MVDQEYAIRIAIDELGSYLSPERIKTMDEDAKAGAEFALRVFGVKIDSHRIHLEHVINRAFDKLGLSGAGPKRKVIRSLFGILHPDKHPGESNDEIMKNLRGRLNQTLSELSRDDHYLEADVSATFTPENIDKPNRGNFENVALLLAKPDLISWDDIEKLLSDDDLRKGKNIEKVIEALDSETSEGISKKRKEAILTLFVKGFLTSAGGNVDLSPKVCLKETGGETSTPVSRRAYFLSEENEIHIYEPLKPLTATIEFLLTHASSRSVDNPNLRKITQYVEKFRRSGSEFPGNVTAEIVNELKKIPAITFLSDEELNAMNPEQRVSKMKLMCGGRGRSRNEKKANLIQIARLLEQTPLDEEFTRVCNEAGERFAATAPLEKLRGWPNLDRAEQKRRLEEILVDLELSFRRSVGEDAKMLFDEENWPKIIYAEPTPSGLHFEKGDKRHNGRNGAVQYYPMVGRSILGPSHTAFAWSRSLGRNIQYQAASFIDYEELDTHNPEGEVLRFPSKKDHPSLSDFRDNGNGGKYFAWNECFDDFDYRQREQKERDDNPFWNNPYPAAVLSEIIDMYFRSLYWQRIPRVFKQQKPKTQGSLYLFATRAERDVIFDKKGNDIGQEVYFHNVAIAIINDAREYDLRDYEGRVPLARNIVAQCPSQRWKSMVCKNLSLKENEMLEICQQWGQNWLKNLTEIHRKMTRLVAYYQTAAALTNVDDPDLLKETHNGLKLRSAILNRLNTFAQGPNGFHYPAPGLVEYYTRSLNKDDLCQNDLDELEAAFWIHHHAYNEHKVDVDTVNTLERYITQGKRTAVRIKANFKNEAKSVVERKKMLESACKQALEAIPVEFSIPDEDEIEDDEMMCFMKKRGREESCLKNYLTYCSNWLLYRHEEQHIRGIELVVELERVIKQRPEGQRDKARNDAFSIIKDQNTKKPLDEILQEIIESLTNPTERGKMTIR